MCIIPICTLSLYIVQDDHDFSSSLSTDELQELCADIIQRLLEPCKKVVTDAKLKFEEIDVIEVVGSATRSPLVQGALKEHFGKEPQRTLNSEEAVSKGCALMGAMMSPNFKVRDFAVVDATPYAISLSWSPSPGAEKMEVEDGDVPAAGKGNVVFTEHNVLPSVKMLTFMRSSTFDISAAYADEKALAPGTSPTIGTSSISVPAAPNGEPTKVKVKVRLDVNGILSVDSAQSVEEVEVEEPKVEAAPKAEGDAAMPDAAADAPPAGDGAAEAPAAEPAGQPAEVKEEPKPEEPIQKKKKLKKHDLVVVNKAAYQLPSSTIDSFKNDEYEMMVQDRQIKELQERKNDLESYIYGMRDRVGGGNLSDYISQADKDVFLPLLDAVTPHPSPQSPIQL